MLKIELKNGETVTWGFDKFFGQNNKTKEDLDYPDQVDCVFADGQELDMIRENFTSIPMNRQAGVVMWRAPWAQFIVDNIC